MKNFDFGFKANAQRRAYTTWQQWFLAAITSFALAGFSLPASASTHRMQPWENWLRNPISIPVTVVVSNIYAQSGSAVTVRLSDGVIIQEGNAPDGTTNAPPFNANLTVRKEYLLTVEADEFWSADVGLACQANWTPLSQSGQASKLKEYHLLVDKNFNSGLIQVSGNGQAYSNAWVLEITEQLPAQWRLEDGSDDPNPAPGDGKWAEIGPGKSLQTNRAAISWSVGLGRLMDGLAAGRLSLRETAITRDSYKPKVLYYTAGSTVVRDEVELIPETPGNPTLRQVKAYQTFVDIVSPSTNETELRFYLPNQIGSETNTFGHYTNITDNPFVVWALVNPELATTNKLRIVERRNGVNRTNEITFDQFSTNGLWTLRYGTGSEQRVETRNVVFTSGATTNRIETVDIRYAGAATPAYRAQETYRLFPWGFELVESRVNPDNNPQTADDLVTTVTFNTDPGDEFSYKQVDTIINPDCSWEKRAYNFDGLYPLAVLRPWGGAPEDPAEATSENSVVTPYYPGMAVISWAPPYGEYKIVRWLHDKPPPTPGVIEDSIVGEDTISWFGWSDPDTFLGDVQKVWGTEAEFGYHKHPITRQSSRDPGTIFYYNSVTYNPTNVTFAVHTNQSPWEGPDWRASAVYTVSDGAFAYGFPDENDDFREARWADGQELFDPIDFGWREPWFVANQSWRDSEVYHNGSLVLRERAVLTNSTQALVAQFDPVCKWVFQNDSLGHATNVTWVDGLTGVSRVIYSADYRGTNAFDGDLLLWETDESGVKTVYEYDSLKRLRSRQKEGVAAAGGFPAQSAITTAYAYDAYGRLVGETNSAGGLAISSHNVFDLAGRLVTQVETNGLTTSYGYELGGRRVVRTLPSGATEIRENYLDGRLKSVTGTGVVNEFHNWSFVGGGEDPYLYYLGMMDTVHLGSVESPRVVWQAYDLPGRLLLNRKPGYPAATNYINAYLSYYGDRCSLPRGHYKTIGYTEYGEELMAVQLPEYDLVGTSTNALLQFWGYAPSLWLPSAYSVGYEASYDRLSRSAHRFTKIGSAWFQCTTNMVYRNDGEGTPTVVVVTLERLSGFASGSTLSEIQTWDADTNLTVTIVTVDRAAKKVTQVVDTPQSTLNATNVTINGLLQSESTTTIASPARYAYDALGRLVAVTNSLGFASTVTFNQYGQVTNQTDFTGNSLACEYYPNGVTGAGQLKCETRQNGRKTYHSYTLRGEPYRTWGHVPYPEERVYSDYGELVELRTFRNGTGWTGSTWPASTGAYDKTTWTYDAASGLLASKTDNSNHSVAYTYKSDLVHTRTWARGVTTTNTYTGFGDLTRLDYSDGTASIELNDYSRSGLPRTIVDAAGTAALTYDHADRLLATAMQNGLFAGVTITNHFDGVYGRDGLQVTGLATALGHSFAYDAYGRLGVVSNGVYSATYGYLSASDLLQTTTCKSNNTTILATTRTWDYGVRLRGITNVANAVNVSSHSYLYDSLNRRIQAVLEDSSAWNYDYNDRDELIGARRYWPDWSLVAGQQFAYDYDNIGNRRSASSGGDSSGAGLHFEAYTANGLNQYTSRTVPGWVQTLGTANASANVALSACGDWCALASRKGEYFRAEVPVDNSAGAVWLTLTNLAALPGNPDIVAKDSGQLVLPKASQTLTYDLDGNLTFDGVWTYEWDAENRLVAMTMTNVSGIPDAQRKRLEFAYDSQYRRVQKVVLTWNGSAFASPVTNLFVYAGWNLLAVLTSDLGLLTSFTWGQDLSGTMDQAGGIGGLLLVTCHTSPNTNSFVAFDGNGNVTALVNAADRSVSARYEFSPFGELLRATGPLAMSNPFRWSTKFWDEESGLVYYGYRYYSPDLGRWFGRDPLQEEAGLNLYAALLNSPLMQVDFDGRSTPLIWLNRSAIVRIFGLLGCLTRMYQTGQPVITAQMLWAQETRAIAARGMQAAMSAPGAVGSTGAGAAGPPKNLYKYAGTGWAVSLVASGLMATYSTVYAGANLALGQRSAYGSYMYTVESGLINTINGETAYADLDFIEAALIETGGVGSAALVGWDTFDESAAAFAAGFNGEP